MRKFFAFKDWEKFLKELGEDLDKTPLGELCLDNVVCPFLKHELKDVAEFEATVICQEETLGAGKFINAKIPDNLDVGNGDKLHIFAVKLEEE